jgi:hypothetical protein
MGTGDVDGEEGVDGELTGVSFIAVPGEGRIGAEAITGEAGMAGAGTAGAGTAGAGTAGAGTAGAEESGSRLSRFIIRATTVIRVTTAAVTGATAGAIIIRVTVTKRR